MCRNLAVLFFALMMASCGRKDNPEEIVLKANEFLKQGDYPEAILNFKKAIGLKADNGAAFLGLGRAYARSGSRFDAYATLSRATELLPKSAEAKVDFGEAALVLFLGDESRPEAVRNQLVKVSDELLALQPGSPEGLRLRAYIALSDKKPQEAIDILEKGLSSNPRQLQLITPLVQAQLLAGRMDLAEVRALEAITIDKAYQPPYDAMIFAADAPPRNYAVLEKFLTLKVQNIPASADAVIGLASFYRNQNRAAELQSTLNLLRDSKRFPDGLIRLSEYYVNFKDPAAAEQTLREAATRQSMREVANRALARLLFYGTKQEEGLKLIDQHIKEFPKDKRALIDRAAMLVELPASDRLPATLKELVTIPAGDANHADALYQQGRIQYRLDDAKGAQATFEQIIKLEPGSLQARGFLADIHLKRGEWSKALQYADELVIGNPRDPRYQLLRAKCLRGLGREQEARAVLQTLLRALPTYGAAALELGELESTQDHYKESELLYRQVLKTTPADLAALGGLAKVLVAQGKAAQAFELLGAQHGKIPQVPLEMVTADVAIAASRYDLAIKSYSSIPEADLPAEAMSRFAEALLRSGAKDEAVRMAKAAAAKAPDQPQRAAFAGYVLESVGRPDEAIQQYESALKIRPDNLEAANNLAYLLADRSQNLERAQTLAETCVKAQPSNHGYLDTLGYVMGKRGQHASAADIFKRAIRSDPNQGIYHLHLAISLQATGDTSGARKEASAALSMPMNDADKRKTQQLLASLR